jgi:hypothetical protein
MQWIRTLLDLTGRVVVCSPSKPKESRDWGHQAMPDGVELLPLPLNDWSGVETLKTIAPTLVLFDRFITEEQFGPLVVEAAPEALLLLETEDLHLLRRARSEAVLKSGSTIELRSETALRETASILRCDHAFVVSSYEARLLECEFGIGPDRVDWIPFSYPDVPGEGSESPFEERTGFQFIGNFRHAPNLDGLRWFRSEIWPEIRKRLPGASFLIHGAYPPAEVMQWDRPAKDGIRVVGSVKRVADAFRSVRVNLAPLRFGAGVKGKLLDGFHHGIPAVSTRIGAEGLFGSEDATRFPGLVTDTAEAFVEACVRLHEDRVLWESSRRLARDRMREICSASRVDALLHARLKTLLQDQKEGRFPRWESRILRHELSASRKYFSRWISVKEELARRS